ncbi:MAG: hypothetical protein V8T31_11790, partial [Lachnospiraceae bacterium]
LTFTLIRLHMLIGRDHIIDGWVGMWSVCTGLVCLAVIGTVLVISDVQLSQCMDGLRFPILRYYALAEVTGDVGGMTRLYLIGQDISTDLFRFWPILTLVVSRISNIGGILETLLTILCLGSSFTTYTVSLRIAALMK